jgi:4-amino-4-deoxychorismate lyase
MNTSLESVRQRQQMHPQEQGVLKLIVTRGDGQRGYMPTQGGSATLISIYKPLHDTFFNENEVRQQNGVEAHICKERLAVSSSLAGIKSLNQLPYVLASRERQTLTAQEGLLLNNDDNVIEATARNLFLVKNKVLYTPLIDQCGVAGVMRRLIIDIVAAQVGVMVKEAHITLLMLKHADEVFLSNSVSGIWPIVSCIVDGVDQQWLVGKVSQKIQYHCHHFRVDERQALASFLSSSTPLSPSPTSLGKN